MKKTILFLTLCVLTLFVNAQDNPTNAAALLNVPQEFVKYNGQIQSKVQYEIIEHRTIDRTDVDTINGKLVRSVDTTYRYTSSPVSQAFGYYSLNILSNYINSNKYQVVNESTLVKPSFYATASVGDFAGQTYFYGGSTVRINPASGGYNYEVVSYPYMNTETNGLPAITPWLTIKQITTIISGSVSISQTRFTVRVTNVSSFTGSPTNVRYTKQQIESRSKLSEAQISELKRTVFVIRSTDGNTNCNSMATGITRSGSKYTGTVYFNGTDAKTFGYRNLMAAYGQKLNGYVTRFHLYNGTVNNTVYGSTFTRQLTESELSEINIVAGSAFSYDATTNTLTYDANKPAELRFEFELLPAQGKQPSWESRINLATGQPVY